MLGDLAAQGASKVVGSGLREISSTGEISLTELSSRGFVAGAKITLKGQKEGNFEILEVKATEVIIKGDGGDIKAPPADLLANYQTKKEIVEEVSVSMQGLFAYFTHNHSIEILIVFSQNTILKLFIFWYPCVKSDVRFLIYMAILLHQYTIFSQNFPIMNQKKKTDRLKSHQ